MSCEGGSSYTALLGYRSRIPRFKPLRDSCSLVGRHIRKCLKAYTSSLWNYEKIVVVEARDGCLNFLSWSLIFKRIISDTTFVSIWVPKIRTIVQESFWQYFSFQFCSYGSLLLLWRISSSCFKFYHLEPFWDVRWHDMSKLKTWNARISLFDWQHDSSIVYLLCL